MNEQLKVAVLIDAENISAKYATTILQEAANLGNVIYKRIYGNWTTTQLSNWKNALLDNAIQPIQQYSNTQGKNSSDSALIIDAMDLLYQKKLDAFCIISSDSDFTRLASRLRESEMIVVGMGEKKTPRAFISACNKFVYLDLLYQANKDDSRKKKTRKRKRHEEQSKAKVQNVEAAATAAAEEAAKAEEAMAEEAVADAKEEEGIASGSDIEQVKDTLRAITEDASDDDGWIPAANLAEILARRMTDFDYRNFGFKKFVPFVESLKMFEGRSVTNPDAPGRAIYFRLLEDWTKEG